MDDAVVAAPLASFSAENLLCVMLPAEALTETFIQALAAAVAAAVAGRGRGFAVLWDARRCLFPSPWPVRYSGDLCRAVGDALCGKAELHIVLATNHVACFAKALAAVFESGVPCFVGACLDEMAAREPRVAAALPQELELLPRGSPFF